MKAKTEHPIYKCNSYKQQLRSLEFVPKKETLPNHGEGLVTNTTEFEQWAET